MLAKTLSNRNKSHIGLASGDVLLVAPLTNRKYLEHKSSRITAFASTMQWYSKLTPFYDDPFQGKPGGAVAKDGKKINAATVALALGE